MLNSYYQFQIPEAEITTYFALRPFNNVDSLLLLVRCNCLYLSLFVFGSCFVFSLCSI